MIKIRKPEIIEESDCTKIRALVERPQGTEYLWYSVEPRFSKFLCVEQMDGFLVALLPLAMQTGEDISVEGAISERLFYNLTNYYMRIVSLMLEGYQRVKIFPERLESQRLAGAEGAVATGFSGGVDSFCVLADHLFGDVPKSYKITHLIFNNVGAHSKHGIGGEELFQRRYERVRPLSEKWGLPLVKIDSNLGPILGKGFQKTHPLRNVSAVLMLQRLFGKYFYASGRRYQDLTIGPAHTLALVDPAAMPLLSTETLECIPTGSQYSRPEKIERVSQVPASYDVLDVCARDSGENCSQCWKCTGTLLALEVLGKADLYKKRFDFEKYRQVRGRHILRMMSENDSLSKEVVEFAAERRYPLPLFPKILSHAGLGWLWHLMPRVR